MKNSCRHIFSAIFGMLLLLPVLAISFLQLGQAYIKSTRGERLESEKLVKVVLPAARVVWEEPEKELWVGDKMFDVATYEVIDGHYHLTGVYDDDETAVVGSLLHLVLSGKTTHLLQLLLLLQCFSIIVLLIDFAFQHSLSQPKFPSYLKQLLAFPKLVLGPPPRQ